MPGLLSEQLSRRNVNKGIAVLLSYLFLRYLPGCSGSITVPQPDGSGDGSGDGSSPFPADSIFDQPNAFEKFKGLSTIELTQQLNEILISGRSTFPVEGSPKNININTARNEAHVAWELIGRETDTLLGLLEGANASLPTISKTVYEAVGKISGELEVGQVQAETPNRYDGEVRSRTANLMSAWLRLGFNRWWWGSNQGSAIERETSRMCFYAAYNIGVSYLRALALEDEKEINNLLNDAIDPELLQIYQIKNIAGAIYNDMSSEEEWVDDFDYIGSINTAEKDRRNIFLETLFANVDNQPMKDTLEQLATELTNSSGSSELSRSIYQQELFELSKNLEIDADGMVVVGREPVDADGNSRPILLTKKEFLASIFFNSPSMVPGFIQSQEPIGQQNTWVTAVVKSGVEGQMFKMINGKLTPVVQLVPGTVIPLPVDKNSQVPWENKEINGVKYIITQPDNFYIPLEAVQIAQTESLLLHRFKKHFETLNFMMYYYFPDFGQLNPHKFNGTITWASKINMGMYKAKNLGDVAMVALKYNPLHLFINTLPSSKIVGYDPGSVIYTNGVPHWISGNPGYEVMTFSSKGYIVKSIEALWKAGKESSEAVSFLLKSLVKSWSK